MKRSTLLLGIWTILACGPVIGMGSNKFEGRAVPNDSAKRGTKRTCYLRFSAGVTKTHQECGLITDEETCNKKKPKCKWLSTLGQCAGEHYSRCMRDVSRHCDKSEFSDKMLHELPDPYALIFACDEKRPEESLIPVK